MQGRQKKRSHEVRKTLRISKAAPSKNSAQGKKESKICLRV